MVHQSEGSVWLEKSVQVGLWQECLSFEPPAGQKAGLDFLGLWMQTVQLVSLPPSL